MDTTTKTPPTAAHKAALTELRAAYEALNALTVQETADAEFAAVEATVAAADAEVEFHEAKARWDEAEFLKATALVAWNWHKTNYHLPRPAP
jgi:hypothetical protein